MVELIVLNYLKSNLIEAYMELPAGADPQKFVVIQKTGSGRVAKGVQSATVSIQSYGKSLYEAASLNEQIKVLMDGIISLESVCSCRINSDYNYTDTTTKRYRYQAVFDIIYYQEV